MVANFLEGLSVFNQWAITARSVHDASIAGESLFYQRWFLYLMKTATQKIQQIITKGFVQL